MIGQQSGAGPIGGLTRVFPSVSFAFVRVGATAPALAYRAQAKTFRFLEISLHHLPPPLYLQIPTDVVLPLV